MAQIIIKRADGGVTLANGILQSADKYFAKWVEGIQVREKRHPDWPKWLPATYRVVVTPLQSNDVSTTFRSAWKDDGTNIVVDMTKARAIHLARIKEARDVKLNGLNNQHIAADDANDAPQKATIAAQRRTLRDLPTNTNLDQFTTPAELAAFWPAELS